MHLICLLVGMGNILPWVWNIWGNLGTGETLMCPGMCFVSRHDRTPVTHSNVRFGPHCLDVSAIVVFDRYGRVQCPAALLRCPFLLSPLPPFPPLPPTPPPPPHSPPPHPPPPNNPHRLQGKGSLTFRHPRRTLRIAEEKVNPLSPLPSRPLLNKETNPCFLIILMHENCSGEDRGR